MNARTVGVVGAGQLGRMLALAGYPLGVDCVFLDRSPGSPAGQVGRALIGRIDDRRDLEALCRQADVVTFDIENVDIEAMTALGGVVPILPPPAAVGVTQDRLTEKRLFEALQIPTAAFVPVSAVEDLATAAQALDWPIVLKARRLGYDGRGQRICRDSAELAAAWRTLGEVPAIAEGWVAFDRELSLLAVCGAGERRYYPLAENRHEDGILRLTIAPYHNEPLQAKAERWLDAVATRLEYRGILAVEFFETRDGLIANEIAPRVHNSGHWTIEGAATSQFENHLRAILGWPLGDTAARGHSVMVNFIGRMPAAESVLAIPNAHLHAYGKRPRPGRKLGHCTIIGEDRDALLARLPSLRALSQTDV